MVYSTSRCPNCGQIIRKQTNPVHKIGNPFERCRHCGNTYLNSYKEEWITKSPIKRFFFFLPSYVWARAIVVPALLFSIFLVTLYDRIDPRIIIILWLISPIIWLIAGYSMHKNANKENIEESLLRTSDPEYLNLLVKAGYRIYPVKNFTPSNNTQISHASNANTSTASDSASHICLSPTSEKNPSPDAMCNMAIQHTNQTATLPQDNTQTSEKEYYSTEDMAGAMAEICLKELADIMDICEKNNVPYNEKKLIVSTFTYFYAIWIFNFENITVGQEEELQEIYKKKFSLFNRYHYENEPFKEVIENEQMLVEQLERVYKRIRKSYQSNNHTFVDDGVSDEFILEFVESKELKEFIKPEIVIKVLKDWAAKAALAGKEFEIK
jgi:hypothetical protein